MSVSPFTYYPFFTGKLVSALEWCDYRSLLSTFTVLVSTAFITRWSSGLSLMKQDLLMKVFLQWDLQLTLFSFVALFVSSFAYHPTIYSAV
jgi:hypothetical protein